MTLQPADLDRLEQLAREAQKAVDEGWTGGPPITRLRAYLSPAVVSALVAAARLGAAWEEAEAALPGGWWFEVYRSPHKEGDINPHTGMVLGPLPGPFVASAQPAWLGDVDGEVVGSGPTPAAALLALAEALRGRP